MIHLWVSPELNSPDFYHFDLIRQLSLVLGVKPRTDHEPDVKGIHVIFVMFSWLNTHSEWFRSLEGPKIVIEHDAYLNFLEPSPYYGAWTRFYKNCNFDLLIASGKGTTNKLRSQGLPSFWVPKGCNEEFLTMTPTDNRFGFFSCPIGEQGTTKKFHYYKSRHEMSEMLDSIIDSISCPVANFPQTILQYAGTVTNDQTMGEPMAKQFEVSALGAVMIRDRQEELLELGFRDESSVVFYDNYYEMTEIVNLYKDKIDRLRKMGNNAREVARNHTWRHRANEIFNFIKPYLIERIFI